MNSFNVTNINIVNLVPHDVVFVDDENSVICTVSPSGMLARVAAQTKVIGSINGIPVTSTEYGDVVGLPDPEEDTIYIVSSMVAKQVPDRKDVFIPNESIRDVNGVIIGCKSLGKV